MPSATNNSTFAVRQSCGIIVKSAIEESTSREGRQPGAKQMRADKPVRVLEHEREMRRDDPILSIMLSAGVWSAFRGRGFKGFPAP